MKERFEKIEFRCEQKADEHWLLYVAERSDGREGGCSSAPSRLPVSLESGKEERQCK